MDYKSDLKRIQFLKNKKFRKEYKQFSIEGEKIINEALESDYSFDGIWLNKDVEHKISEKADQRGIEIKFVSQKWLERAGNLQSNSFGIAILNEPKSKKPDLQNGWSLLLDSINDPGNLGTIVRTADWFGIKTIICSLNTVELYNPKVLMASKGSFLRVNIFYADPEPILSAFKDSVIGADMVGDSIHTLELKTKNGILVMGSESHGISKELQPYLSQKVHIPGNGKTDSLNVGIATSIILDNLNRNNIL